MELGQERIRAATHRRNTNQ